MSEAEFDAEIGRKLRDYSEIRKKLQELTVSVRTLSETLSAIGFALFAFNSGELKDEAKAQQALASLPPDLTPDIIRDRIAELKQVRGRYLDLKSQLQAYGID